MFGKLILQKDKNIVKSADIRRLLKRRMQMWKDDLLEELIQEAELCDKKMPKSVSKMSEEKAIKVFSGMILQGKIRQALRFITDRSETGGILSPDDDAGKGKTVQEILQSKHPEQKAPDPEAFLACDELPVLIDIDVTGEHVLKTAPRLSGGAGVSALDATQWHNLLLKHGGASEKLRESIAALTRRLANTIVDWDDIRAMKASKLIALDKCPGVRPIGIGDVAARLCAKVMLFITGDDVQSECLADQICSGLKSGIEGSIHAFRNLFNNHAQDGWGMLLMDAANAFNSISRSVVIWNSRVLWFRCSRFIFNSYRGFAILFIAASKVSLLSKEGVTQGDPLAMPAYGVGSLPLARKLKNPEKWKQNWYADDSSCIAVFDLLIEWLKLLILEGPKYGYFPEPEKSYLVVHPDFVDIAKEKFADFKMNIVTSHRFLGGFIGNDDDVSSWISKKVDVWVNSIQKLATVAQHEPQAAFVAFTKSLQCEWTFIQRVIIDMQHHFSPLRLAIQESFLPSLFGSQVDALEAEIMCTPSRNGGIGVLDPVKTALPQFVTSREATSYLSEVICKGSNFDLNAHDSQRQFAFSKKVEYEKLSKIESAAILDSFPEPRKKCIQRKLEFQCSGWLSVIPVEGNHFDMSPNEFRDALALRYGRTPIDLPTHCDADGEVFSVNHALNCAKGGLVYGRHNELRDLNCSLLELAGLKQVISEPIILETNDKQLRADWGARGFWEPQKQALFDCCIINAESASLQHTPLQSIFNTRKNKKLSTYSQAAKARRASFTPILATCDAVFDQDAELYIKRLSVILSKKWKSSYAKTVGFIRARLQICILRSVSLCLRGCRTKCRGASIEDAAAIPKMEWD